MSGDASGGQNAGVRLHVAADDRTGALEVAAALADRCGQPVPVAIWPDSPPSRSSIGVVDLCSRHLPIGDARDRAGGLTASGHLAHKIDSTLRGNWAGEVAARSWATGRAVLVVPALPALGRMCLNGEVLLHGRPVHETWVGNDVRSGVSTSRPAEMLAAFGVRATAIGSAAALEHWGATPGEVAVCDAASDADLDAIGRWWRDHPDVLLAGTSAVLAAAVEPVAGVDAVTVPAGPKLVVAGSLSPVARAQIDVAVLGGAAMTADHEAAVAHLVAGRHVIVTSDASRVAAADADRVVAGLASAAHAILADERSRSVVSAVVVLGGDTAAIVLGDALVAVLGTVGPGTAVVESLLCDVPIITRAGGFGDPDGLVRLL